MSKLLYKPELFVNVTKAGTTILFDVKHRNKYIHIPTDVVYNCYKLLDIRINNFILSDRYETPRSISPIILNNWYCATGGLFQWAILPTDHKDFYYIVGTHFATITP